MRPRDLSWLEGRLPSDLRALTVRQPWAWAIANGEKRVENRPQPLPGKFLGEIVAIHAGSFRFDEAHVAEASKKIGRIIEPASLTTGSVVGFARLVGSIRRRSELKTARDRKWFHGPHGWLLDDVVLLDEPVPCAGQLGFWRVTRRVLSKLRAQVANASRPPLPRVFSWGYKGWGTSIPQTVEMFDLVEKARGFRAPLLVDIRARREVRSEGFTGPKSPFIRALGSSRYRWLNELGNAAVATRRGSMRLVAPAAINELLGLVLRAQHEQRRVVFFCSCASPGEFHKCHRRLVAKQLVKVARTLGLSLAVEEWPGGAPRRTSVTVRVDAADFDGLCSGDSSIDLGRRRPAAKVLGLPVGSVITVKSKGREAFAAVLPPLFRRRRWQMPIYLFPFDQDDSARFLADEAKRRRRIDRLHTLTTDT